ncbi:MAG: COX15/CtaA family protein [Lewinellaceae bacterium]|nr:COX15/CtaA family protein [Lewinellaceae bacterium]
MNTHTSIRPAVRYWLLAGVIMVFFQVVIGGVTRLTDSGLSITEWAVIQGTLPPMNEAQWQKAFEAYKVAARKQYETLHADMTLGEFKVIFFWEYIHRLWARLMGLVFLVPFLFFWAKKWIPKWLIARLGIVIFLATLAATFGWIMVASGLNDDTRTWVSAYKLIIHLLIATFLFGVLFWTWLLSNGRPPAEEYSRRIRRWGWSLSAVLLVQIALGGLMAGMRAGLVHPHFPFFIHGQSLLDALSARDGASIGSWIDYEPALSVKAWAQVAHRTFAYLLTILILALLLKLHKWNPSAQLIKAAWLLFAALFLQFLLGVLTVISCIGRVPVTYGVLHQGGALLLLAALLYLTYRGGFSGRKA